MSSLNSQPKEFKKSLKATSEVQVKREGQATAPKDQKQILAGISNNTKASFESNNKQKKKKKRKSKS
jgi:hypothetical protein